MGNDGKHCREEEQRCLDYCKGTQTADVGQGGETNRCGQGMAGDSEAIETACPPDFHGEVFLRRKTGSERWIMGEKLPGQFLPHSIFPELKNLEARAWPRDDEKDWRPGLQVSQNGLKRACKSVFDLFVNLQPELNETKVLAGFEIEDGEVRVTRKWFVKHAATQALSEASIKIVPPFRGFRKLEGRPAEERTFGIIQAVEKRQECLLKRFLILEEAVRN
jgi:hypothetical protein